MAHFENLIESYDPVDAILSAQDIIGYVDKREVLATWTSYNMPPGN